MFPSGRHPSRIPQGDRFALGVVPNLKLRSCALHPVASVHCQRLGRCLVGVSSRHKHRRRNIDTNKLEGVWFCSFVKLLYMAGNATSGAVLCSNVRGTLQKYCIYSFLTCTDLFGLGLRLCCLADLEASFEYRLYD